MLLSHPEVDINAVDKNNRSALHMACWGKEGGKEGKKVADIIVEDFPEGMQLLLDHGADETIADRDGNTPLLVSCSTNALRCVKIWHSRKADFNVKNLYQENALLICIRYGVMDVIKFICENVDIDYKTTAEQGLGILEYAVHYNHLSVYEYLLEFLKSKQEYEMILKSFADPKTPVEMREKVIVMILPIPEFRSLAFSKLTRVDLSILLTHSNARCSQSLTEFMLEAFEKSDKISFLLATADNLAIDFFHNLITKEIDHFKDLLYKNTTEVLGSLSPKTWSCMDIMKQFLNLFDIDQLMTFKNDKSQNVCILLMIHANHEGLNHLAIIFQNFRVSHGERIKELINQKDIYSLNLIDYSFKAKNYLIAEMFKNLFSEKDQYNFSFQKVEILSVRNVNEDELKVVQTAEPPLDDSQRFIDHILTDEFRELRSLFQSHDMIQSYNLHFEKHGIDDESSFAECLTVISRSAIIGLDMEYTSPQFENKKFQIFTLIQIAVPGRVFILDAVKLFPLLVTQLKVVFENPSILKLIYSCSGDVKILYSFLGIRLVNFLDVALAYNLYYNDPAVTGLSTFCKKVE